MPILSCTKFFHFNLIGASIGCFKGAVVARGALCAGRDLVAAAQDDKAAITVWRWNTVCLSAECLTLSGKKKSIPFRFLLCP